MVRGGQGSRGGSKYEQYFHLNYERKEAVCKLCDKVLHIKSKRNHLKHKHSISRYIPTRGPCPMLSTCWLFHFNGDKKYVVPEKFGTFFVLSPTLNVQHSILCILCVKHAQHDSNTIETCWLHTEQNTFKWPQQ